MAFLSGKFRTILIQDPCILGERMVAGLEFKLYVVENSGDMGEVAMERMVVS